MNALQRSSVFLAALIVAGVASSAGADYDVRDYLPDGEIFELTNMSEDLWVDWDDTAEQLAVMVGTVSMVASTWMNNDGTLGFDAMPGVGQGNGLVLVKGTIDLLPEGDFLLFVDVYWDSPVVEAAQATHRDGATIAPKTCDCSDGITINCTTNKCNANDECPGPPVPASGTTQCEWQP